MYEVKREMFVRCLHRSKSKLYVPLWVVSSIKANVNSMRDTTAKKFGFVFFCLVLVFFIGFVRVYVFVGVVFLYVGSVIFVFWVVFVIVLCILFWVVCVVWGGA